MDTMKKVDFRYNKSGDRVALRHGTPTAYRYGCRCDVCRDSYREQSRKARERRLSRPIPDHVHGTWNGYSNYSCRCELCLEACRQRYPDAAAYREVNRERINNRRREYYKESGK